MSLPISLLNDRGLVGVLFIWRPDGSGHKPVGCSVGEFLARPENQSGRWLIEMGQGYPPGPVAVDWEDGDWVIGNRSSLR